jgi:hypothetical protein
MNRPHATPPPSPGNTGHPKKYRPQALSGRKATLRTYLTRYAGAVSILALLILAGAIGKTLFSDPRSDAVSPIPTTGSALFFDLATGKLITAPDTLPSSSSIGPDMKTGLIRAYVLSCDGCSTESGKKIIYMEAFTVNAIQRLHAMGVDTYTQLNAEQASVIEQCIGTNARYVRPREQNKWVAVESTEAHWVLTAFSDFRCPQSNTPTLCLK